MASVIKRAVRCAKAMQYDGTNAADLRAFVLAVPGVAVSGTNVGAGTIAVTLSTNGGPAAGGATDTWNLNTGDWVVIEGANIYPIDAATMANDWITHP